MPPSRRASTELSRPRRQARSSRAHAGDRGPDLAERLRAAEAALETRAARRDLFLQMVRRVNATFEPAEIASIALEYLADWIVAPQWIVLTTEDPSGTASVVAERGVHPSLKSALAAFGSEAVAAKALIGVADLEQRAEPGGLRGAAVSIPLVCGDRAFGAIVLADPEPSARTPGLRAAAETALGVLIEPLAGGLEKALRIARAESLSVTDDLTKLYNSRYLNLALRREVKRSARNQRPLSLLFVDLDGFKMINDTYGHLTGSRALVEIGAVIRDSARETDVVARFGGDEFAVILPDTNAPGARAVAERVCQRVAAHRLAVEGERQVTLTASVGVATLPDAAGSPDALMQAADVAMYRVKERGKNGIETAPVLTDT